MIVHKQYAYVQMSREFLIDAGLIEPTWAEREADAIMRRRFGFRVHVWRRRHGLTGEQIRKVIAHRIYPFSDDD